MTPPPLSLSLSLSHLSYYYSTDEPRVIGSMTGGDDIATDDVRTCIHPH